MSWYKVACLRNNDRVFFRYEMYYYHYDSLFIIYKTIIVMISNAMKQHGT
jgi:hypothetical protein